MPTESIVTQFSSTTLLLLAFGHIVFDQSAFSNFGSQLSGHSDIAPLIFFGLRMLAIILLFAIWSMKAEGPPVSGLLPILQASTLLLISFVLSMQGFVETFVLNPNNLENSSRLLCSQAGLKVAPLLTHFVLRDTPFEAIVAAWAICIVSVLVCDLHIHSSDRLSALLAFSFSSAMILYDSYRRDKSMIGIVTQLQDALKANERLAIEAQALELRAMIGNVAHDLKTVRVALK